MIQHQTLQTKIIRIVWKTVKRITKDILEAKGFSLLPPPPPPFFFTGEMLVHYGSFPFFLSLKNQEFPTQFPATQSSVMRLSVLGEKSWQELDQKLKPQSPVNLTRLLNANMASFYLLVNRLLPKHTLSFKGLQWGSDMVWILLIEIGKSIWEACIRGIPLSLSS